VSTSIQQLCGRKVSFFASWQCTIISKTVQIIIILGKRIAQYLNIFYFMYSALFLMRLVQRPKNFMLGLRPFSLEAFYDFSLISNAFTCSDPLNPPLHDHQEFVSLTLLLSPFSPPRISKKILWLAQLASSSSAVLICQENNSDFLLIPFNLQAVQIHSANGVKLLEAWRGVLSSTPPYK
jgi:hypothetical protein